MGGMRGENNVMEKKCNGEGLGQIYRKGSGQSQQRECGAKVSHVQRIMRRRWHDG